MYLIFRMQYLLRYHTSEGFYKTKDRPEEILRDRKALDEEQKNILVIKSAQTPSMCAV